MRDAKSKGGGVMAIGWLGPCPHGMSDSVCVRCAETWVRIEILKSLEKFEDAYGVAVEGVRLLSIDMTSNGGGGPNRLRDVAIDYRKIGGYPPPSGSVANSRSAA